MQTTKLIVMIAKAVVIKPLQYLTSTELRIISLGLLCLVIAGNSYAQDTNEVNIYSYRQTYLIEPMLQKFSQETDIKTNVVYISTGIAEKLRFEGSKSPADIVLTVDIYRLSELKQKGLTASVESKVLSRRIPAAFRDKDNHWFSLTQRARIIYATNDVTRAPLDEVTSYLDLARPGLGKRVCIRPLSHIYNLGLTASLMTQYGIAETQNWLKGLKANLARRPQGNDREQIKAITNGLCDYAVANSYYFNLLAKDDPKWTRNIRFITPKSKQGGTHMNVSGMTLTRYAPNRANAIKLMEFLVSNWAQDIYAVSNNEIPVVESIAKNSPAANELGNFERQNIAIETLATFINQAQRLVTDSKIDL